MAKISLKINKEGPKPIKNANPSGKILLKVSKQPQAYLNDPNKEIDTNLSNYTNSAKKFFNYYLNSPLYKTRLINQGYDNPQATINDRLKNLNNTTIVKGEGTDTGYVGDSKTILVDPNTFKLDPGSKLKDTIAHELSHASGAVNPDDASYSKEFTNPGINANDYNEIYKRNKLKSITPESLGAYLKGVYPSINPALIDTYKDNLKEHDLQPSENKADLDALRYMLHEDKIYDAGKQPFTNEILQKAKTKYSDSGAKRLFRNFSDEDIIWMMNNIAKNKTPNAINEA